MGKRPVIHEILTTIPGKEKTKGLWKKRTDYNFNFTPGPGRDDSASGKDPCLSWIRSRMRSASRFLWPRLLRGSPPAPDSTRTSEKNIPAFMWTEATFERL